MPEGSRERNIHLLLEYDGSAYFGWQRQDGQPTVQGCLEDALNQTLGHIPTLAVAGRTDAGVHAIGQVANFKTHSTINDWQFAPALNNYLPDDISVHQSREVEPDFNARNDSESKRYRYRIYQGPQHAALEHTRAWCIRSSIDIPAMRQASEHLIGEHDFNAFRSTHCDAAHAIRHMMAIDITETERPPVGRYIEITFHANAYCRHMCRILAGALGEVGIGKRSVESIREALVSRDRTKAGITAPPGGLTLMEVIYP